MIRLRASFLAAIVAAFGHGVVAAACPYPDDVEVPDGSSATEQDMLSGQKRVKAYMAEMEDYLKCLDDESMALGDAVTDEQRQLHVDRHNAAVEAMESVANAFNEQIRAYKAVNN